jgi:hypothetical protein
MVWRIHVPPLVDLDEETSEYHLELLPSQVSYVLPQFLTMEAIHFDIWPAGYPNHFAGMHFGSVHL